MTGEAVEQSGMIVQWLGLFPCAMMSRLHRNLTSEFTSWIICFQLMVLYDALQCDVPAAR